jgi:hypothetical protein
MGNDYPIKTCDLCKVKGKMGTFMSGETICMKCLTSMPTDAKSLRRLLFEVRAENAALRTQVADWHKLADERSAEIVRLRERMARLVEAARKLEGDLEPMVCEHLHSKRRQLRVDVLQAVAEAEAKCTQ